VLISFVQTSAPFDPVSQVRNFRQSPGKGESVVSRRLVAASKVLHGILLACPEVGMEVGAGKLLFEVTTTAYVPSAIVSDLTYTKGLRLSVGLFEWLQHFIWPALL
jgi:hypothetical protein